MWFERGDIARSGLVVPLASVRLPVDLAILFGSGFIPIALAYLIVWQYLLLSIEQI